jgi:hypothetical protein
VFQIRVYRDATLLATLYGSAYPPAVDAANAVTISYKLSDAPSAGTYTYSIKGQAGYTKVALNRSLIVTELKK